MFFYSSRHIKNNSQIVVNIWAQGDFNGDGSIDGADFNIWRTSPNVPAGGDGPIPTAPIVVNSDAEQVIIAQRNAKGEISYLAGSLENPQIRDQALQILEGGVDAFKKRQEKYRMVPSSLSQS